jgi:hypothetical protein
MGFKEFDVDELVELSSNRVTKRIIREMRQEHGEDLTIAQLLD